MKEDLCYVTDLIDVGYRGFTVKVTKVAIKFFLKPKYC